MKKSWCYFSDRLKLPWLRKESCESRGEYILVLNAPLWLYRSFFSKSPAPSKASNKPRGSASPHTNGSTNDDGVKEPLADSPILRTKSKRKRVIIDSSDDDEDQEGGVVDTNGSLANGSGLENGTKNGTSTPPPTTPTSISGNNVATPASASAARNDTTPSITPASVAASSIATPLSVAGSSTDGLTPKTTPPRRKTGEWQLLDDSGALGAMP